MQARLKLAPSHPVAAPSAPDPVAALRLARSRNVGPATWLRLVQRFGTPARALEALPDLARRGGAREFGVCSLDQAEKELQRGEDAGARLLVLGGPGYPAPLARIPDPPPVLWLRGDPAAFLRPAAALVGGRNASALGLRLAEALGRDLAAAGWCVVSGLARGVDGAAHRGALGARPSAPGATLAVLAGGVDHVYPSEHAALADQIAAHGALVSEAPPGLEPQARHFPRRNRIVAGLARGVLVVEAAERSGSLITAQFALEQGREVMAVPGAPLDPRSAGGNALIREGATLVRSSADVIEALSPSLDPDTSEAPETTPAPGALNDPGLAENAPAFSRPAAGADAAVRARVAELLGLQPVEEDVLARLSGAPLAAVAETLMELELAGRLDRRPGGFLALLPD